MPRPPLILVLALTLALPARADIGQMVALVDTNGDGTIAREEVVALRLEIFRRIDADSDGTLTRAEIEAAEAAAEARRAARDPWALDSNGDDALSPEEFTSVLPGFDRADRDGDGLLSAAEIERVKRVAAALGQRLD